MLGSDCITQKNQFATRQAAQSVAMSVGQDQPRRVRSYRCQFCRAGMLAIGAAPLASPETGGHASNVANEKTSRANTVDGG
jgi:hypothetical protein